MIRMKDGMTKEIPDIKAVFFDVDGTLLSRSLHMVPDSAKRALAKLQERGIRILVATGRFIDEYETMPMQDIPFDGYLVLNGSLILDKNREILARSPIDPGEMEVLAEIFRGKRIPFALIGENGRYINYVDDTVIKTQTEIQGIVPEIKSYDGEVIYQILAFVPDKQRKLLESILDECLVTSWNETGVDIVPKGGGKAAGIRTYMESQGLRREEIMAFGDGENDMDMLQLAGIGVAMGNATDSVKEVADYVTDTLENDGIEKALQHFGLID